MNINSTKHKVLSLTTRKRLLTLLAITFCSFFLFSNIASATKEKEQIPDEKLKELSENKIFLLKPCFPSSDTGSTFSSICGNTAKEKYWSALRQTFDEIHAAAIFGSIVHEGSFGPTLWQYSLVPANSNAFANDITWNKLFNCSNGNCPGGIGAFQITWSLGPYLRYVNEKNPSLINYFKDPTYSLKGDAALDKIGATDYDKLVQQEINFILNSVNQEEFNSTTTLEEATDWWTTHYENCANCCGLADKDHSCEQRDIRRASAQKEYDEMKNFTCSGVTSHSSQRSSANTSQFTLLEGYGNLTFYGPDAASNGGYAGRNGTESINGGALADGQVARDTRDGGALAFGDIIYIETTSDEGAETSHANGRYFIVADTGGETAHSDKWDIDVFVDEPNPSALNYPPFGSTPNAKIYKVASGVSWDEYLATYANGGPNCDEISGENITWIGDSYSTGAQSIIEREFPGISFGGPVNTDQSYIQDCKFVAIDTNCLANPTNPSGFKVLKRIIDSGNLKPYLVMALGTNGDWNESSIQELQNILSSYPDTKVILVTARTTLSDYSHSNELLRNLANSNDNYYLADWAAAYDAQYFGNDSEHPTTNGGYEKWVSIISDAINSSKVCNSQEDACSGPNDSPAAGEAAKVPLEKRVEWLFPNGVPSSEDEMKQYKTDIIVDIIDESGNRSKLPLTVHKKLEPEIRLIFDEMMKVKNFRIKPDVDSYEWRLTESGTGRMSQHSYGVAIDINPDDNPATYTGGSYNPGGNYFSITDEIVQIWKKHGFYWGGDWNGYYKDYMHFTYTNH